MKTSYDDLTRVDRIQPLLLSAANPSVIATQFASSVESRSNVASVKKQIGHVYRSVPKHQGETCSSTRANRDCSQRSSFRLRRNSSTGPVHELEVLWDGRMERLINFIVK